TRAMLLRWSPARGDLIAVPLLVCWLAASLQYNWYTIFVSWPQAQRGDLMTAICRAVEDAPLPATIYMVGGAIMAEPKVASNDCMIAANPERTLIDLADDPAVVPIPPTNRGNAIILVSAQQQELVPLVRHYYPEARYDVTHEPHYGSATLHRFTLTSDAIERARGLRGTYQSPRRTWTAAAGSHVFTAPPEVEAADFPLRATWRGELWIEAPGAYAFSSSASLRLDGATVAGEAPIQLAAGWHAVELSALLHGADESVVWQWRTPAGSAFAAIPRAVLHTHPHAHGLLGRFFAAAIVEPGARPIAAVPDYTRIDSALSFDFYRQFDEPPVPPFTAPNSTVEWVGTVDISENIQPALRLEATAPAQAFLNGSLVAAIDSPRDAPSTTVELPGIRGRVAILVRTMRPASDTGEFWKLRLLWRAAGGEWTAFADYRFGTE
ncbi:MAG TPA: hypothetical protein VL403_05140, partial [Candidatus Kryptonia bacterium]|nr:hypothetical protein [Candidatus Kryptonia bacterium]